MSDKTQSFDGHALICVRGERVVFTNLSFSLGAGDALVLRGPNGSGKSSLLRITAGLLKPAAGRLAWHDGDVADAPATHRARLVFVGHQDAVKPVLSVVENLAFWAGLSGAPEAGRAALAPVGLADLADAPAHLLSAGQRRRLTLARLHLRPQALWLLDEPSVGLDADSLAGLEAAIRAHRERGGMVILATHTNIALDSERVLDLADHAPAPGADYTALAL